jgi:PAS domain-containing protein
MFIITMTAPALAGEALYGFIPPLAPTGAADEIFYGRWPSVNAALLAAFSLAIACCFWALSERTRACAFRRSARDQEGLALLSLGLRDAIIRECGGDLLISGTNLAKPLVFGAAASLLSACKSGPDADELSAAQHALVEAGQAFSLTARTRDNHRVTVRGKPIAGHAALLLNAGNTETSVAESRQSQSVDPLCLLDALPIPAWIRGADMKLAFVNRVFLEFTGANSGKDAIDSGVALDGCEAELAADARDSGELVSTKRYITVGRSRRAVSFTLFPLSEGGVIGTALELGPATGAAQNDLLNGLGAALNGVAEAVAIFSADRHLVYYNNAYAQLWALPKAWLDTFPTHAQILDRLREGQRLPEQHDFAVWKTTQLDKFAHGEGCSEELWHLPGRKTVRLRSQPRHNGGLMLIFHDVTEQLDLQSALVVRANVQKATLELHPEGATVFGADGRLRFHNDAFARLWNLPALSLSGEPHMGCIAQDCIRQFGDDGTWALVSMGVNSSHFEQQGEAYDVRRCDGRILAILFKRLPDGSTFVGFTDVTGQRPLEAALRENAA